jgi:hypothetical protein
MGKGGCTLWAGGGVNKGKKYKKLDSNEQSNHKQQLNIGFKNTKSKENINKLRKNQKASLLNNQITVIYDIYLMILNKPKKKLEDVCNNMKNEQKEQNVILEGTLYISFKKLDSYERSIIMQKNKTKRTNMNTN